MTFAEFCFAMFGALCAVVITLGAVAITYKEEVEKEKTEARKAARAELTERENKLGQEERAIHKWHNDFFKWQADEIARIDKLRREAEATKVRADEHEQRVTAAIKKASEMSTELPPTTAYESLSVKLRELHLQGFQLGKYLTVQFIGSLDGFVRIRWSVQLDRPEPPRVDLTRDNDAVHTSYGFAGEHGDILKPGRRYLYKFDVYDHAGKSLAERLVREVYVPSARTLGIDVAELASPLTSSNAHDARMRATFARHVSSLRLVHELTEAALREVRFWDVDDEIKEWAKSEIESFAAHLRESNLKV